MLKKLNTKTLLIIFAALVAVALLTRIFDSREGARTFKEELVNVDTSLVSEILLYPRQEQHKEIKFTRGGNAWTVQKENISAEADTAYVRNLLGTFSLIKPQRLAATDESKWKDFNVDDSLGTRVKFLSGGKMLLDIVVGKFSYNNMTRSGISYLRLAGEDEVYAVDGFIPMAVNQPFNEWRNKVLLRGNKEDWAKISFSYPDSSFTLRKENGKWMTEGGELDSNKVEQYLNDLSYLTNSAFADNYSPPASPVMWLTFEGNNMASPVTLKAFPADSMNQYIIHSSYNPNAYFSAAKGNLTGRVFKKLTDFLKQPEEVKN
jgi:hypothetical protein